VVNEEMILRRKLNMAEKLLADLYSSIDCGQHPVAADRILQFLGGGDERVGMMFVANERRAEMQFAWPSFNPYAPTDEERAQDDFNPVPRLCLVDTAGAERSGYVLAGQGEDGIYFAEFEIKGSFNAAGARLKYSDKVSPRLVNFDKSRYVSDNRDGPNPLLGPDVFHVHLRPALVSYG
jgi:hypothetical protein